MTLVSEDTYRRLHWCDPDEHDDHNDHVFSETVFSEVVFSESVFSESDESYPVMKVTQCWKLSSNESYLVMKVI